MSINAKFPAGVKELVIHGLHQWDIGQTLTISGSGMPDACEVHFAYPGRSEAIVCECHRVDGTIAVAIPDECLAQALPVVVWVYAVGATYGETTHVVVLPVQARPKPATTITPAEPVLIDYTIEENGVHTAPDGVGFNKVTVAVPTKTKDVSIAANGTYPYSTLTGDIDVYPGLITVQVASGGGSAGFYISGTYVMREQISLPLGPMEQIVSFTANGTAFSKIKVDPTNLWFVTASGAEILVYSEHDISSPYAPWLELTYKTLTFGSAYQPITSDFSSWLSGNSSVQYGDFTLQTKTVAPSKDPQTVGPDSGYDGLRQVNVTGDPDLIASNIKSGVSIFGVTGTYSGSGGGGSATLIEKSVTPTNDTQVLLPSSQGADGYSKVTVAPIPTTSIPPITANGTYSIEQLTGSDDRYPDSITVNVPTGGGSSGVIPTCKIKFTESATYNWGSNSTLMDPPPANFTKISVYNPSTGTFSELNQSDIVPDTEYIVLLGTIIDQGCYGPWTVSGGSVTLWEYGYSTGSECMYRIDCVASNIGATITFGD